jgi:hypothetical protein
MNAYSRSSSRSDANESRTVPNLDLELVTFAKTDKTPLSKRIYFDDEGRRVSDGSPCQMGRGGAKRSKFTSLAEFADKIGAMDPRYAIGLGSLRAGLADDNTVVTKRQYLSYGDNVPDDTITRTADFIQYRPGQQALALLDYDTKGMPSSIRQRIDEMGGVEKALISVLPELSNAGRIVRASTSAGLYRSDTGEKLSGSDGKHIYVLVEDGVDIKRFLETFHQRCWLAGLGWHMVGGGGQLLDRSIVDRSVFAPERLVFEGAPTITPPLAQDASARKPIVLEGAALCTATACPPLSIAERSQLERAKARSANELKPQAAKERRSFVGRKEKQLVEERGLLPHIAKAIAERWTQGQLLSSVVLPWDDPDIAGSTVGDVLSDPLRFAGETLADPLEGPEYGICKAKIMLNAAGEPWIHSFAHGRTTYELFYDADHLESVIDEAEVAEVLEALVPLLVRAKLDKATEERLKEKVFKKAGVARNIFNSQYKAANGEREQQRKEEQRQRRAAERTDTRPQIRAPRADAPFLPVMEEINSVLGACKMPEPPMRGLDGHLTVVRSRSVAGMHRLTSAETNGEGESESGDQSLLSQLNELEAAELIEQHIDHINEDEQSVHLPSAFVKHYMRRDDGALPLVGSISTLPLVSPTGALQATNGLDRHSQTVFRIPKAILDVVPLAEHCSDDAVEAAMRFLLDEWLCDVPADAVGKCTLIAAALTLIERTTFDGAPAFFVTANRRGGGKTTALTMLMLAVTGVAPSAAAWSTDEEERRKAVLSYLLEGVPAIIWDNIPRGAQLSCPHIEAAITSEFIDGRRLGATEKVRAPAHTIHLFTGNNIAPKGDLASRSLRVPLMVDRYDPENRAFKHTDPLSWTLQHRPEILRALYTILLSCPSRFSDPDLSPKTRFKAWWTMVGQPLEDAALAIDVSLDFKVLMFQGEEADEHSSQLAEILIGFSRQWNERRFSAADIARLVNNDSEQKMADEKDLSAAIRDFFLPDKRYPGAVSGQSLGRAMKRFLEEPVPYDGQTLMLRAEKDKHSKTLVYFISKT